MSNEGGVTTTTIILKEKRDRPFRFRHPWIFSGAIGKIDGTPADGDEVVVVDTKKKFIARGVYNSKSQIAVRLYSWAEEAALEEDFWRGRIRQAIEHRKSIFESGQACRLINSEGDGLSGLVLDWYPPFGVVQFMSLALDARREVLLRLIQEATGIEHLFERSDGSICKYEGLPERSGVLLGDEPPKMHTIKENDLELLVDLQEGHKTGYYLDQRRNRARASALARPGRVLDVCCYTGSFGIHAAAAGAKVIAIDQARQALELAKQNAINNGLEGRYSKRLSPAATELRSLAEANEKFETIILDPPKFAHSKRELEKAAKGYHELNLRAMQVAAEGALLYTCSCSGAMDLYSFQSILLGAAHDAGRDLQILEVHFQAEDHPFLISCPESQYLKCLICRVW
ncbi:MAG: class I SAM-dependent rRNA methyltransferase [Planctomycetota bacterium]|nr:class I SAM-dependent rRNA methyltransferase [Planctomycetota bacterium]MDA1140357.1 class I SAM-dependent rRNA methyltransferase [Planctomycetota bacterium]